MHAMWEHWCVPSFRYEIAANPGVQSKLVAELTALGLLHQDGTPARDLQQSDLSDLHYVNLVFKESMRLHTIAPGGSVR